MGSRLIADELLGPVVAPVAMPAGGARDWQGFGMIETAREAAWAMLRDDAMKWWRAYPRHGHTIAYRREPEQGPALGHPFYPSRDLGYVPWLRIPSERGDGAAVGTIVAVGSAFGPDWERGAGSALEVLWVPKLAPTGPEIAPDRSGTRWESLCDRFTRLAQEPTGIRLGPSGDVRVSILHRLTWDGGLPAPPRFLVEWCHFTPGREWPFTHTVEQELDGAFGLTETEASRFCLRLAGAEPPRQPCSAADSQAPWWYSSLAPAGEVLVAAIDVLMEREMEVGYPEVVGDQVVEGASVNAASDLRPASWFSGATGGSIGSDVLRQAVNRGTLRQSRKIQGRWRHSISEVVVHYSEYAVRIQRALGMEQADHGT